MVDVTGLATLTPAAMSHLKNYPPMLKAAEDGILGFDEDGLWIFQGNAEENYKPYRDPQGTGLSAIVISNDDSWNSGSQFSSAQFPLLQVLIYSDATRGVDSTVLKKDQKTKAFYLYSLVDDLLHDTANEVHELFGMQIISTLRGFGPRIETVPDTAGLVRCTVKYEVLLAH